MLMIDKYIYDSEINIDELLPSKKQMKNLSGEEMFLISTYRNLSPEKKNRARNFFLFDLDDDWGANVPEKKT
jgi:hypothetical protein